MSNALFLSHTCLYMFQVNIGLFQGKTVEVMVESGRTAGAHLKMEATCHIGNPLVIIDVESP